ncbi:MAG: restriction endonuclease [Dehalococcoidia bacterium]|nr:restriction endonuclease [Dehalococcoidia bacterium]
MMWPTIQALKQLGNSATIKEINNKVAELESFSEAQLSILHANGPQTEIDYRLAWSRTYLRIDGALENSARGVWAITEYGLAFREADIPSIVDRVRKRSVAKPHAGLDSNSFDNQNSPEIADPLESMTWQEELLEVLQKMPPAAFERLCQRVLREAGFTSVQVTGKIGDGGIDGIGVLKISLLNFQVLFQCKRYSGSVGPSVIRDFRGAMIGRTDKGLVLTTGSFTSDARKEATRDGAPVIDLIDGNDLCTLLKDLNLGITKQQVEEVGVDRAWFDSL